MASLPDKIGKYKILNHLGSGGTSIVYLGMHPTLKRKVVLKKLNLRGKKTFYDRFLQEAALMMDLNHDHIVKVYDHFKEGSRHYMVMEFVEGLSLDQIIEKSGPLNHETIRYVMRCCCKALDYIHSRNIIHRDIKPSNIFISCKGDVKLGDFGVALLDDPSIDDVSAAGSLVGTPSYMAPEQFSPKGRVTARTDLYALGVSYFELLTGQKMFTGESLEELRDAIRRGRHLSLLFLIPSYGFSCWRFIRKSCSRFSLFRYPSAKRAFRSLRSFRMSDENFIQDLSGRIQFLSPGTKSKTLSESQVQSLGFSEVLGASPRTVRGRRPLSILAVMLFITACTVYLFTSGSFYKWFLPDRYGKISIILDKNGPGDTFPVENLDIRLKLGDPTGSWSDVRVKGTETELFKKSGYYRMRSTWGNHSVTRSFYLPPVSAGDEPYAIKLISPPISEEKLHLRVILSDVYSGQLLPLERSVSLHKGEGIWAPLTGDIDLYAGKSYEVSVKVPGYFEETYILSPEFYQDEYLLDAALVPLPGELEIHHNLDRLVLEIDHRRKLKSAGKDGKFQYFGKLELEPPIWKIPPGIHILTWSGSGWEQEQKLTVRSGEKVVYRITMDAGGKPRFSVDRKPLDD